MSGLDADSKKKIKELLLDLLRAIALVIVSRRR